MNNQCDAQFYRDILSDVHSFDAILDSREIFVGPQYDSYLDFPMIEYHTCQQFIRNIQVLNAINNDTILVHMMVCGGNWNYGMGMYDAIKASSSNIVILSYAGACSMSSIIPQAATTRVLMPNTEYLVHYAEYNISGGFTQMVADTNWYKKCNENMLKIYVDRIKEADFFKDYSETQVLQWLQSTLDTKQQFYMSPREAVEFGFADAVLGDKGYETIKCLR
jgi:ATP-dependent protease ClpP protease subunit